jgi:rRNA-processing protein FCF1
MPPKAPSVPGKPLLDTNVLFGFLLWQFSTKTQTEVDRSALGPLRPEPLREPMRWYFDVAKPLQTCPHVIAEIHGLARSRAGLHGPVLQSFWSFAQVELSRLGLREELVKVTEMEGETLRLFGPTDTALLALAAKPGGLVLTDDHELMGRCAKQEIPVLRCSDVLDMWQRMTA